MTENTKTGARGLILPASSQIGNPAEDTLLPGTVAELERLGIKLREVALDGGFNAGPTNTALADLPKTVFIAGRQEPGSKRTQRRLRRYRTGEEGRISHLKRRYGLDRSRLKGDEGQQIWTGWAILAYNTDTLAVRKPVKHSQPLLRQEQTHYYERPREITPRPFRISRVFPRQVVSSALLGSA